MEYVITAIVILAIVGIGLFTIWLTGKPDQQDEELSSGPMPTDTRQIPEVSEDFEVPEEDQQYLLPITVEVLKKLAFTKRMAPTNAMLIEHLAEALSEAAQSFEPRKNNSQSPQIGNEDWLFVAAFAIRLWDEGTPHNSRETRDSFVAQGTLAGRRLQQWARKLNHEIAQQVRDGVIDRKDVKQVTEHVRTVGATPYTEDEIEDMKKGAEEQSKFEKIIRGGK